MSPPRSRRCFDASTSSASRSGTYPRRHVRAGEQTAGHQDVSGSFECRRAVPSPCTGGSASSSWSNHTYGHAIDLPPREPLRRLWSQTRPRPGAVPRPDPAAEGNGAPRSSPLSARSAGAGVATGRGRRRTAGASRTTDTRPLSETASWPAGRAGAVAAATVVRAGAPKRSMRPPNAIAQTANHAQPSITPAITSESQ